MKFKKGDMVKVCASSRWKTRIKNTIGIVSMVNGCSSILVEWGTKECVICGIGNPCNYPENKQWNKPSEIEPAIKVGEQLLFSFMES